MTAKEAAQQLGISTDTLKARIRRAGFVMDKDDYGRGIVTDEMLQAVSTTHKDYNTGRSDNSRTESEVLLDSYTTQIEGLQRENKSLSDMVGLLRDQLAIKDMQISDLSKALHQEQSLHLLTAKAEDPMSESEPSHPDPTEPETPKKRKPFWRRG